MQPWRDTTLLEAIAGRLKELRAGKGVSQETVYEDTGCTSAKSKRPDTMSPSVRFRNSAITTASR